ncbi:hypothetical protein KJ953_03825 [Patescibacteria group bacterium]|nr:hypothetical protein [Patescibacteria group bacterium]MBU1256836.1 hypothetical protein [Patescibacteria group bacterium]MBU1457862.1 hypothetical protein [Patescibacteria group bacterium]
MSAPSFPYLPALPTLTPSTGSQTDEVLDELPPPGLNAPKGDIEAYKLALSGVGYSQHLNFLLTGESVSFGVGVWCEELPGRIFENYAGSQYCSMHVSQVGLQMGVFQGDMQNPDNIEVYEVGENYAGIIFRVPTLYLNTPTSPTGSSQKSTLDEPWRFYYVIDSGGRWVIDWFVDSDELDRDVIAELRDRVDNCSSALADVEAMAPTPPDGRNSMNNLEETWWTSAESITQTSGDPSNPNAYDSLWVTLDVLAKANGFNGLAELKFILPGTPTRLQDWLFFDGRTVEQDIQEALVDCGENGYQVEITKAWLDAVPADWKATIPPEWWAEIYQAAP